MNTNISSNSTINLNQAITIGALNIGDSSGNSRFTIAPNGGSLTFDVSAGNAAITRVTTGTGADAVSAGITLNDDIDVTVSSTNGSLTLSGIIGGSGKALNKLGAGTLTLSGGNTYSGATTISAGMLTVSGTAGAIASSSGYTVTGGGTLSLDYTSGAAVNRLNNSGAVSLSGGGALTLTGNTTTNTSETFGSLAIGAGSPTVTIGSATSRVTTLTAGAGSNSFTRSDNGVALIRGKSLNQSVTSNVSRFTLGDGGASLTLVGTNTLNNGATNDATQALKIVPYLIGGITITDTGSNFVTYDTTLGLRVLTTAEQTALTAGSVTQANPINAIGAGVTIAAANLTVNSLLFNGAQALNGTATALMVNSGAVALMANNAASIGSGFSSLTLGNGEGVVTVTQNTLTINASIDVTDGGGLTKAGAGTLILSNTSNAYTGNTTISGGSLKFGNPTVLQNSTLNYVSGGGSIDFGELTAVTIGGLAGDKNLVLENTSAAAVALTVGQNDANTEYTGNLSGGGRLVKVGAGTLTLNTNSYAGDTTLVDGILRVRAASLGSTGHIIFQGGTLQYNGHSTDFSGRIDPIDGGEMAKIDTDVENVSFGTVNGLSGEGGLSKLGAGTLALNVANDYQGGTIVSGGTLLVSNTSGSGTGTGSVTVDNGGTLGGSGTIGGAVIVDAGGHLAPGASVDILNVGTVAAPKSVTMAADSIYVWEFDGTGDTVAIQGDLTLTSGWKLTLVDAGGTPAQHVKYDLFTYTGSLTGSVAAAIDYGSTSWSAASVGQEAGKVYLIFGTRPGVLSVAGSPTYDEATQTGFKAGSVEVTVTSGWGVNNSGMAVGSSVKYVGGGDKGLRAVRWDASGAAATELGTLGTDINGYTAAVALAVNDAGTAVGRLLKNGNFRDVRAVRWNASGTAATELGNLGLSSTGTTIAEAYAVNAGGTAVGSAQMYDSGNDMGRRAVRWDASGVATELPNLGLTTSSSKAYAYAINDANTAVGFSQKPGGLSHLGTRAVRWNASGAVTELGNLGLRIDGVTDARAVAVNALGTAVGWATKYIDGNSMGDRAVRWGGSGTAATELGSLGLDGGNSTNAYTYALNGSGTAVGYAQKYVGGNLVGTRAVRWDGTGTAATELGNLGLDINSSTEARAYAVNGAGSAVGYSQKYVGGSDKGDRAVIWLPDAGAIDLNDLGVVPVPTGGTWILTTARAISADGWVAGEGTFDPDGGGPLAGYVRHWVTQVGLGGTWMNPAGGTWGRGPNWSTGTPAMQVGNATFNLNSVYAVALDRDELTQNIAINAGTVTINFNGHKLAAESGLTIAGGATLKGDGTIVSDIINSGTLGSTGTIAGAVTVNDGGRLAPGAGIGMLNVGTVDDPKSLTMAVGSIYDWELGSTSADEVVVTGDLTLADGWKVTLVDAGGTPKFADKFDLFAFDGAWGGGTGAAIISAGSTGWDVSRASTVRDGAKVYITGIAGLPGDTNDDGVVDATDYITVKQNFGMTDADWSQGNFTVGDGTVDWDDLQILMAHFGPRSIGGAPAAPEPTTLFVMMAAGLPALLKRRRRRS